MITLLKRKANAAVVLPVLPYALKMQLIWLPTKKVFYILKLTAMYV